MWVKLQAQLSNVQKHRPRCPSKPEGGSGKIILLFRLVVFVFKKRTQRTKMAAIFDEFYMYAMVLETSKHANIRDISQRLDTTGHETQSWVMAMYMVAK